LPFEPVYIGDNPDVIIPQVPERIVRPGRARRAERFKQLPDVLVDFQVRQQATAFVVAPAERIKKEQGLVRRTLITFFPHGDVIEAVS
jgi:hypothetical protein